jgi:hypothetical protein
MDGYGQLRSEPTHLGTISHPENSLVSNFESYKKLVVPHQQEIKITMLIFKV